METQELFSYQKHSSTSKSPFAVVTSNKPALFPLVKDLNQMFILIHINKDLCREQPEIMLTGTVSNVFESTNDQGCITTEHALVDSIKNRRDGFNNEYTIFLPSQDNVAHEIIHLNVETF